MTTRIRKGFKGVATTAAAGLLAVLSMTTATQASAGARDTAAWLGQMEVTATVSRAVAKQAKTVIANLGSMTVTATRVSTVAKAHRPETISTGESESTRTKSPRAVLVQ